MRPEDFDYPLPKELIAQTPADRRDASRLLVADRSAGILKDAKFTDIVDLVPAGDLLVLNDTRVFPARLLARKEGTGGKMDVLVLDLEPVAVDAGGAPLHRCLLQPSPREGQVYLLDGGEPLRFVDRDRDGVPRVAFPPDIAVRELLRRYGRIPLPPYIKRDAAGEDGERYQTVYAAREGAVAAPTAGLHFTQDLLGRLKAKGVGLAAVTLHVGYGTFRPVEDLVNHRMHAEAFELSPGTADAVNACRDRGGKVWAVGTTALRTLETCVVKRRVVPGNGWTDLYITPPFTFEAVDRLITNFHLPKTTLLLLVSAFMGEELRRRAYEHALRERYRFYSYGDAMVIL
ncbi:MAG: S-adenosylmethionine:tRNA ribosyltransferase-isomerase [Candidatus Omnitrophica bacterium]|nr:S-adenosylmethionine:tRNA ribosyltransferase-isomerase [Candidatus Omnitrophota bacterium]